MPHRRHPCPQGPACALGPQPGQPYTKKKAPLMGRRKGVSSRSGALNIGGFLFLWTPGEIFGGMPSHPLTAPRTDFSLHAALYVQRLLALSIS